MRKRKSVREKAHYNAWKLWPSSTVEHGLARLGYVRGAEYGHRANRISAAERRVVEAAVEWVKPPLWSGDATKAGLKLASAVDALQRAKGGANG